MANRVAVAISGSGRTLKNLLEQQNNYGYEVAAVVASSTQCAGLRYAEQARLPACTLNFNKQTDSEKNYLETWLTKNNINWVALAGFLKPWPTLTAYQNQTVNIHPALLPKHGGKGFYGAKVHQAVLDAGEHKSGATIHFVNDHYDQGRIIAQTTVEVKSTDNPTTLADRVFAAECLLYPDALDRLINGQLPLAEQKIWHFEAEPQSC